MSTDRRENSAAELVEAFAAAGLVVGSTDARWRSLLNQRQLPAAELVEASVRLSERMGVMSSEDRVRANRAMLRIRDLIDREYSADLDIEALARQAGLSRDHLIRTFATVFGETPHRYLQRRRIERAMHLLRTTDLPVTEVCLAVGYDSLGAFSSLFTTVVGVSPSAYRSDVDRHPPANVHHSFVKAWTRPSSHTHPSISKKRQGGSAS